MNDPLVGWILGTAAMLFCAVLIGMYIHYLRHREDINNTIRTLAKYPLESFNLQQFHYDTMQALASSPKKDDLVREHAYIEGRGGYKLFTPRLWAKAYGETSRGEYSVAYLMRSLIEAFDEIELVKQVDSEGLCTHRIYKLHRGEEYCYLEVGSISVNQFWGKKAEKPIYHSDTFTVDNYLSDAGDIEVLSSNQHGYALRVLLPIEQSNLKYELIIEALAASRMAATDYHEIVPNKAFIHKITLGRGGGYDLKEYEMDAARIEDASKYYGPVEVQHNGTSIMLPADAVIALGCTSLLNGGNVALFGPAGSGKTRKAAEMARRLSNMRDVDVIMLDPSTVSSLSNATMMAMFEAALDELPEKSLKVLLLDETETLLRKASDDTHTGDNTFMLSILDGLQSALRNTVVLMTFNAGPETLNQKIFRPGRIRYIFHMQGIGRAQADELVRYLKTKLDFEDKVFDDGAYAQLFSSSETTTVAAVTRCFLSKDENEILTKDFELLKTDPAHAKVMLARLDGMTVYKKRTVRDLLNGEDSVGTQPAVLNSSGQLAG